jgi:HlyD family secretion protein
MALFATGGKIHNLRLTIEEEMKRLIQLGFVLAFILSQILQFSCKTKTAQPGMLEVSGLIEAIETEIRSQVQGEVKEILVREGQQVKKEDLLCLLDEEKLTIQLNQVRATIEGSSSKLKLFQKGTKKELIAVAKNQLEAAEKELELAQKNKERMDILFNEGAVSTTQKEQADLKLKAAQENYESTEENYQLALRGKEKEEIEMVKAEIRSLQAQEEFLLRQIQDTRIASPITGFLETRHIEVGELALPGTLLFSLIDLSRTYVKAYVPEKYIGKVIIGSKVEVLCDSFPDKVFQGKVDFISDQAEFAPKNIQTKEERLKLVFMIKSYLENPQRELKPGMPVDVKISVGQ